MVTRRVAPLFFLLVLAAVPFRAFAIREGEAQAGTDPWTEQEGQIRNGRCWDIELSGEYGFLACGANGVQVADFTDHQRIPVLVQIRTAGPCSAVEVAGDRLYTSEGTAGVGVYAIADPARPELLDRMIFPGGFIRETCVVGDLIYAVDCSGRVRVVRVDPSGRLSLLSELICEGGAPYDVCADERYAYVANGSTLTTFDMADPAAPRALDVHVTGAEANGVALRGDALYLTIGFSGLAMFTLEDPTRPRWLRNLHVASMTVDVALDGTQAYISLRNSGFVIADLATTETARSINTVTTAGTVAQVRRHGDLILQVEPARGLIVRRYDDCLANSTVGSVFLGDHQTMNVAVRDGRALMASNYWGLQLLDVSDPTAPVELSRVTTHELFFDIDLEEDRVAVTVDENGIQFYEIVKDRALSLLGQWSLPRSGRALGIALEGDYAYAALGPAGFAVLDLRDPLIRTVQVIDTPGNAIDVCVRGGLAFLSDSAGGLRIFDVADPERPVLLSTLIEGTFVRCASSVDGYVFFTTMAGALVVASIADPRNPQVVRQFALPGTGTSLTVLDRYVYVACGYTGVIVVDIANPLSPRFSTIIDTPGSACDVAVEGDYAYVADNQNGLSILRLP